MSPTTATGACTVGGIGMGWLGAAGAGAAQSRPFSSQTELPCPAVEMEPPTAMHLPTLKMD